MDNYSHQVYTAKYKIQFSSSKTNAAEDYRIQTMNIQACLNQTGTKADWERSINIQLSLSQLAILWSVMSGKSKHCEFFRDNTTVKFTIQSDPEKADKEPKFVYMYASEQKLNLQLNHRIAWNDALVISHLALHQYQKNLPEMSAEFLAGSLNNQIQNFKPVIKNKPAT